MPLLETKNISHRFEDQASWLFRDLNLALEKAESVSVVGPSGSGKTTLINLLSGILSPVEGRVFFEGRDFAQLGMTERRKLYREKIAFVFQESLLLDEYTLEENCLLPSLLSKNNPDIDKLNKLFEALGLSHRSNAFPSQVSGGEKQRASIARALLGGPAVLFADEPTGSLDEKNADQVSGLLFDACERSGCALVLVTHDLQLAARARNKVVLDKHRKTAG
jgi:putative ABC transport system ATP-binding protein